MLRASAIYAARLRRELILRNHEYAKAYGLSHALSHGGQPVVCYEPAGEVHGNFHPAAYAAILDNSEWMKRLAKAHTSKRSALPPNERGFWAELDSCNSSDALLTWRARIRRCTQHARAERDRCSAVWLEGTRSP